MTDDELLFPVTTFRRVFDTMPVQEVLTLPELVAALRRFEIRPQVLARMQREIARARRATQRVKAGLHAAGPFESRLRKAAEEARADRRDPIAAIEAMGLRLEDEARKNAKKDLRVWSPTLYSPGADKRGGDHVTQLSCIVLDYDDGTTAEEASARWSRYFHIVHSTWSHTEAHPRFRLVLPLAHWVPAGAWERVWSWAATSSGHVIDPALKNPSSHYALPSVPNENWPRFAFSRPGALLSPALEGLVEQVPSIALHPQRPTDGSPSIIRGEDPTRRWIDHFDGESLHFADLGEESWDPGARALPDPSLDDEIESGSEGVAPQHVQEASATNGPPEPSAPPSLEALVQRIEALEARLTGHTLVADLERLARLHESGALTDSELEAAKARLLGR